MCLEKSQPILWMLLAGWTCQNLDMNIHLWVTGYSGYMMDIYVYIWRCACIVAFIYYIIKTHRMCFMFVTLSKIPPINKSSYLYLTVIQYFCVSRFLSLPSPLLFQVWTMPLPLPESPLACLSRYPSVKNARNACDPLNFHSSSAYSPIPFPLQPPGRLSVNSSRPRRLNSAQNWQPPPPPLRIVLTSPLPLLALEDKVKISC